MTPELRATRILHDGLEIAKDKLSDVILTKICLTFSLKLGGVKFRPYPVQPEADFLILGKADPKTFYTYQNTKLKKYASSTGMAPKKDDFETFLEGINEPEEKYPKLRLGALLP